MGSHCSSCVMGSRSPVPSIARVDLRPLKNASEHRTELFDLVRRPDDPRLVVRRGQKFSVLVRLDREWDADAFDLLLVLKTGKRPRVDDGTLVRLPLLPEPRIEKRTSWQAWGEAGGSEGGPALLVSIITAPDAVVARWDLEFHVQAKPDSANRMPLPPAFLVTGLYVLFNPWCYEDAVYHKKEDKLQEYVLNDVGKIWRGVVSSFRGMVWTYGQFEQGILEACMDVLDRSPRLRPAQRGNPIAVCREVSAMVNANDADLGIVVGNWSGKYEDGVAPTEWQGSTRILQQWVETGRPVSYGQCWVFAGVLTTVLRALGIPCRPISNFDSAHDTDGTLTFDVFVDEEGKRIEDKNEDSVWNFHVWNEAWMARADLPQGYGGWQIVDSTPQERSQGIFQTGPASLVAVRKGEVALKYDTTFVFAEVNSDRVYWLYRGPDEPLEVLRIDAESIGNFVSTKRPGTPKLGNEDRKDLTHRYKPPERSQEERIAVLTAMKTSRSPARNIYYNSESRDIEVKLQLRSMPLIGEELVVDLVLKNLSSEARTVLGVVRIHTMLYTGTLYQPVKVVQVDTLLPGSKDTSIEIRVTSQEYLGKLVDQASLLSSAMLRVQETNQMFHAEKHFRVRLPDISLQIDEPFKANTRGKIRAKFRNPLPLALTGGRLILEGSGLERAARSSVGTVDPEASAEVELEVMPNRNGDLTLTASFCSKELSDVVGSVNVHVG